MQITTQKLNHGNVIDFEIWDFENLLLLKQVSVPNDCGAANESLEC